jgi:KUP system potassium uptake protein
MREVWRWSFVGAAAVAGGFLVIDTTFFAANLTKVVEGGYVPLILAGLAYFVMVVWHVGTASVSMRLQEAVMPVGEFIKKSRKAEFHACPAQPCF